jgi:hypothetical protein
MDKKSINCKNLIFTCGTLSRKYIVGILFGLLLFLVTPSLINGAWAQSGYIVTVTFNSIKVHDDHDPFFSGEWHVNAALRISGDGCIIGLPDCQKTKEIDLTSKGPGLNDVDDGQTVGFNDATVSMIVKPTDALGLLVYGYEEDQPPQDPHDQIGAVAQVFNGPNFGGGSPPQPHSDTSQANPPDTATSGDYTINYSIEVKPLPF